MHLPLVAIVGRPNVGKSTLLNTLAERRVSVVDPTAGVTRDRVTAVVDSGDRAFELMDTGGIGIVDWQDLSDDVEAQIQAALESADVIVFVVDGKTGPTSLDSQVARRLRALDRPFLFVANKVEGRRVEEALVEFHELGLGDPLPISAKNRMNTRELRDQIVAQLPEDAPTEVPKADIQVALVGRRNAGKSTFVNAMAGEPRVIVSEKPGTTRDAVDVTIERDGKRWVFIDTAGIVRRADDGKNPIQWYSEHRAYRSIRRADVILLMIDATRDVGKLEERLARAIAESFKPCIVVTNKWDLVENVVTEEYEEYFARAMPRLTYAPLAFVSAQQGTNLRNTLELCSELHEMGGRKFPTAALNKWAQDALEQRSPRIKSSRAARIYYATQVDSHPPTIALFVNDPELFDPPYRRYLDNKFRSDFDLWEIPVRLHLRRRERKDLTTLKYGPNH